MAELFMSGSGNRILLFCLFLKRQLSQNKEIVGKYQFVPRQSSVFAKESGNEELCVFTGSKDTRPVNSYEAEMGSTNYRGNYKEYENDGNSFC